MENGQRNSRAEFEAKRLAGIKVLVEKYGGWNLGCVYMDNGWTLRYGAVVNVTTVNGKEVVQVSRTPIPDERTMSVILVDHHDFVDARNILDVYDPMDVDHAAETSL